MTARASKRGKPSRLQVGELEFRVRWSDQRRTLGITVDRDGSLVLAAPPRAPVSALEDFVREKSEWIHTKLAEKELLRLPSKPKEFVSGEGFSYLGRSYRLLLVDGQEEPLKLVAGRFRLRRDLAPQGREHFIRWYIEHGERWLQKPVDRYAKRMGVEPGPVEVRDLGYRWGSCGKSALHFHWATMTLPPLLIEYVVVHELAHRLIPHHGDAFWRTVWLALPTWEGLRAKLCGELPVTL